MGNPCHILCSHLPSCKSEKARVESRQLTVDSPNVNRHGLTAWRLLVSARISAPIVRIVISPEIWITREIITPYLPVAGSYRQQNNSTSSTGEPILFADASTNPRRRSREG